MVAQDPDVARRAHALFMEALEQPTATRTAFLEARAADDSRLLQEVQSLFKSHRESADFMAEPALPVGTGHPDRIGPYRIVKVLGEGGMGIVYLAEQQVPVKRQVALKIIKLGMDTRRVQNRFQLERQALAMMNHPGIARVFEVGTTGRGQAYFAMEFVDGLPISDFCEEHDVALDQRLELIQGVCLAVQHAHQKGILHRDLKPSNVLVSMEDGHPRPHVIDFGVSRALRPNDDCSRTETEGGAVVGTPDYMSPEQAGVGGPDVDTRTDVYSLGILLYELVVGDRPYRFGSGSTPGFLEAQRRLEPAAAPPPRPSRQGHPVPMELEWIILKAIDHDRSKRYGTPTELAEDLQRFLRHEPVHVGPPAPTYLLRKFVQRNLRMVIAGSLILISLLAGLGTASYMWRQSELAKLETDQMLGNYRSVADDFQLRELLNDAQRLWPAWPSKIPEMNEWVHQANVLLKRIPIHQASLQESTTFEVGEQQWLNQRRATLLEELESLEEGGTEMASIPVMKFRVELAQKLQQVTLVQHQADWERAIDSIQDGNLNPQYRGLQLQPQIGLIPLAPDPQSGLWEFLVWGSGVAPERKPNGAWNIQPEIGVILVLLPGGMATIGADPEDDPATCKLEGPRHTVDLQPFFLSKYELSHSQWERLEATTQLPTETPKLGVELTSGEALLPLGDKSWIEIRDHLAWLGLEFPTEVQWEYGARAGTLEPWACPQDQLPQYANLRDQSAFEDYISRGREHEAYDDGYSMSSPIGSYLANSFGIHDVHGNVWEWCQDPLDVYENPGGLVDLTWPLMSPDPADVDRTVRGGSYMAMGFGARLSIRVGQQTRRRSPATGVRPARRIIEK